MKLVSIPFKRESISERHWRSEHERQPCHFVSIPFKRESISERDSGGIDGLQQDTSFNSLQTGKHIWTPWVCKRTHRSLRVRFQFPSNGKVYLNSVYMKNARAFTLTFQFPSNGKVYLNDMMAAAADMSQESFNSLQTGKYIWTGANTRIHPWYREVSIPFKRESGFRVDPDEWAWCAAFLFQFPSNGKVDSELSIMISQCSKKSFNSLQTGKWIQRWLNNENDGSPPMCFNSLQTGKWIQS